MDRWRPLTGGKVEWFGQTEDQAATLLEADHGSGSLALSILASQSFGLTSVPMNEKAGCLHGEFRTRKVDRIEGEAEIAAVALEIGGPSGLHASRDDGTERNELVPFDDNGLVDHCLEGAVGVRIFCGYGILQAYREQCSGGEILRIAEREVGFGREAIVLSAGRIARTG